MWWMMKNSEGRIRFFFLRHPKKDRAQQIQEKSSSFILFLRQGHHSLSSVPSSFHLLSVSKFFLAGSAGATSTAPQSPASPKSSAPSTFIRNPESLKLRCGSLPPSCRILNQLFLFLFSSLVAHIVRDALMQGRRYPYREKVPELPH